MKYAASFCFTAAFICMCLLPWGGKFEWQKPVYSETLFNALVIVEGKAPDAWAGFLAILSALIGAAAPFAKLKHLSCKLLSVASAVTAFSTFCVITYPLWIASMNGFQLRHGGGLTYVFLFLAIVFSPFAKSRQPASKQS